MARPLPPLPQIVKPVTVATPAPCPYQIDGPDGSRLPLHGGLPTLADHIGRHFVEPAARAALVSAHPSLAEIDVFACAAAAKRFMSRREHDPSFDAVALAYARVLQLAIVEAAALGWSVCVDRLSSVYLDSSGLLVVIGGAQVRTPFIPGVDRVASELEQGHQRHNERNSRLAREAKWSGDERYYYRVLRPAMRAIRNFPTSGVHGDVQYGALKRVLPAVADLGFAGWRSIRAQRGHAPMMPPLP